MRPPGSREETEKPWTRRLGSLPSPSNADGLWRGPRVRARAPVLHPPRLGLCTAAHPGGPLRALLVQRNAEGLAAVGNTGQVWGREQPHSAPLPPTTQLPYSSSPQWRSPRLAVSVALHSVSVPGRRARTQTRPSYLGDAQLLQGRLGGSYTAAPARRQAGGARSASRSNSLYELFRCQQKGGPWDKEHC